MSAGKKSTGEPKQQGPLVQYWAAADEGRFVVAQCERCRQRFLPPRMFCPACGSESMAWVDSDGRGALYAFSVVAKAPSPAYAQSVPYVIALATLDDLSAGSRFYGRLVDVDPERVRVGQRVEVVIREMEEARRLPVLRLSEGS